MQTAILILLILILLGGFPGLGLQHPWGYGPSGLAGILLLILVVLILTGRL